MTYKTRCRYFTGYKPCRFKRPCTGCPNYDEVRERIAIVSLEALGAVLRSTCLLEPIRRKYPKAYITWITMPGSLPLLENNPLIDRVLPVNAQNQFVFEHLEFDWVVGVDKSLQAGALVEALKSHRKTGFGLDPLGTIRPLNPEAQYQYDVGLDDDLKFFRNQKPETQQLTESMSLSWNRDPYVLKLTASEKREVKRRRSRLGPMSAPIIGFNTGCSTLFPYKKFTVERSIELIRAWRLAFPEAVIALLGGREDEKRQQLMKGAFVNDRQVINTPTTEGLRSGIIWMDTADIVFSGCSLGLHIAIALQKYTLAWFGVSCAQEIDLYDRGAKINARVPCTPCWKKSCDNNPKCYDEVSITEIVQLTESLLSQARSETHGE